jgi:hypothetical protein
MAGNLSKLRHVLDVGKRSTPLECIANDGIKFLKPKRGGLDRLIENFKTFFFISSSKSLMIDQKLRITG